MEEDVEGLSVLYFQGYVVIHMIHGQTYVRLTCYLIVLSNNPHLGVLSLFLHWQQNKLLSLLQPQQSVVVTQYLRLHLCLCRYCHQHCSHDCCHYFFHSVIHLLFWNSAAKIRQKPS